MGWDCPLSVAASHIPGSLALHLCDSCALGQVRNCPPPVLLIAMKKVDGCYGTESCCQRMEKNTTAHRDTGHHPCVLACWTWEHTLVYV
jgi:hypothetical protein